MNKVSKIGFWSAILSIVFAAGYDIAQLLSWFKVIDYPKDQFWLFLPSLFLAPAFLITIICLHYCVEKEMKIWTAIGVAFAIIYSSFATLNYFVELTVVIPPLVKGEINETNMLVFKPGSFMFAIDCLGYFFMSLSTLFAAFSFSATHKNLYRWMLVNGLLIIIFIPAYFYPFLYFIGSVWAITFILAMIYAAKLFRTNKIVT